MFIVLEGLDGAGKSTQIALLTKWFQSREKEVTTCRDPGCTSLGEAVRAILLDQKSNIGLVSEMLLYMAARAQLVEEFISPALAEGKVVICDRFLLSNIVYQGDGGGLKIDTIKSVGKVATAGLAPDLTLILDLPIEELAARMARPLDRLEARQTAEYRARLRAGFIREAHLEPDRVALIDAMGSAEKVFERILARVLLQLENTPGMQLEM